VLGESTGQENKAAPHKGSSIVNKLKEPVINAPRRTVARYRAAMNIPNSRLRRQMN